MDITEDNYVAGLQAKNEKALKFFIEHDGWIVKSIVHKMMAKYQDKQEECMNDIFLAVWKNVDRYTGEKASFRTWLTAVARYQVLSHIRDIRYHDYVSLMMWSLLGIQMSKADCLMRKKCWNSKSCWRFCRRKTGRYSPRFSGTKKAMRKSGRR